FSSSSVVYTLSLHDALPISQAHHVLFLFFFDQEEAAHRQIHQGRRDVAHGRLVVHESAGFTGRQLLGRRVLSGDGAQARVAAAGDRKSTRLNSSHGSISYAV